MHVQVMDYAAPSRARQVRLWVWVMAGLTFACVLVASMPFSLKGAARADSARRNAARRDLAMLQLALEAFEQETGRSPTAAEGLGALMNRPAGVPNWGGPYLRPKDFQSIDPWARPYIYAPPVAPSRGPVVMSLGPDGKAGTGDDIVFGP